MNDWNKGLCTALTYLLLKVAVLSNFTIYVLDFRSNKLVKAKPLEKICSWRKYNLKHIAQSVLKRFDEIFLRIPWVWHWLGTWLWKGTSKAIRNYFVNLAIVVPLLQCINGVSQIPGWSVQVVFFFLKSECWCQISSDESCPSSFTMVLSTSPWILYKY